MLLNNEDGTVKHIARPPVERVPSRREVLAAMSRLSQLIGATDPETLRVLESFVLPKVRG